VDSHEDAAGSDVTSEPTPWEPSKPVERVIATDVSRTTTCGLGGAWAWVTVDETVEGTDETLFTATLRSVSLTDRLEEGLSVSTCYSRGMARNRRMLSLSDGLTAVPTECVPLEGGSAIRYYRWALVNLAVGAVSPALFKDWSDASRIVAWAGLVCGLSGPGDPHGFACRESAPPWSIVWEPPPDAGGEDIHSVEVVDGRLLYRTFDAVYLVSSPSIPPRRLPRFSEGGAIFCADDSILMSTVLDDNERYIVRLREDGTLDVEIGPYGLLPERNQSMPLWTFGGTNGPWLMALDDCRDYLYVRGAGSSSELVRVRPEVGEQRVLASSLVHYLRAKPPERRAVLFVEGEPWGCQATGWLLSATMQSPLYLGVRPALTFISGVLHGHSLYAGVYEPESVPDTEPCDAPKVQLAYRDLAGADAWTGFGPTAAYAFVRPGAAPGALIGMTAQSIGIVNGSAPLADQWRWSVTRWWIDLEGGVLESETVADNSLAGYVSCGSCDLFTMTSDEGASFDVLAQCFETATR